MIGVGKIELFAPRGITCMVSLSRDAPLGVDPFFSLGLGPDLGLGQWH